MKNYNIGFNRKVVYVERGYISVDAENAKEAKYAAIELLESGVNPTDYDGDVVDLDVDPDTTFTEEDYDVQITDVEQMADLDDEEEEI